MVLVGDALHTAHFSIGSGTRLAMEDVIALVKGLEAAPGDVRAGLARYEALRRPILDKLLTAANASAAWHEQLRRAHGAPAEGLRDELHHPLGARGHGRVCGRCRRSSCGTSKGHERRDETEKRRGEPE